MTAFTVAAPGRPPVLLEAEPGQNLVQAVYLSGLFEPPGLCAGLGFCGRCRMRYAADSSAAPEPTPKDRRVLKAEDLAQGWRLGCEHLPHESASLILPDFVRLAARPQDDRSALALDRQADLGLALDLGTTSVHWSCVASGKVQATPARPKAAVMVNPQMGAGGDVMSRLALALESDGLARLQRLTLNQTRHMLSGCPAAEICLAANSVMTYIFMGLPVRGLAHAPYRLDYQGGDYARLPGLPPVWTAPLIAPFIGGDVSAGFASLAYADAEPEYPFLMADLGTNGEFLLCLDQERAVATSLPLGPALEGAGLNCGAEARPGVITAFNLGPSGFEPVIMEGGTGLKPQGISGTGFISLLRLLRRNSLIDRSGRFCAAAGPATPLARRLAKGFGIAPSGEQAYFVAPDLYLSAGDVEELLKIRAAFALAMRALLQNAGLEVRDLKAVYLAGSLGLHVSAQALADLDFIPQGQAGLVRSVGNSSLAGAVLLLQKPELRSGLTAWCRRVTSLNLAQQPGFHNAFAAEMHF